MFGYCNRALDQRAADATDALHSEPGAALRSWSAIDHDLADDAPVVPVANAVDWWLTSTRVDNYQTGMQDIGPLLLANSGFDSPIDQSASPTYVVMPPAW